MNDKVVLGFVIGIACLGALILFAVIARAVERCRESNRSETLKVVAARLGLTFSASQDDDLLSAMQAFSLFHKGKKRKMRNVMTAAADGDQLAVFDYQYVDDSGEASATIRHTVGCMQSDRLALPAFQLSSENFFHRIGAAFGMQDIDFEEHPEFSATFRLKGDDETTIRGMFDMQLMDELVERKDICIEAAPGAFICHRLGRKKSREVEKAIDETYAIYQLFLARLERV